MRRYARPSQTAFGDLSENERSTCLTIRSSFASSRPMPRGPNGRKPVNKSVLTLTVGLVLLALQPSRAADRDPAVSPPRVGAADVIEPIQENADCSKGTVEQRLDCLNLEIVELKQRLEGKSVSVLPLVQ
jgi:hypothetical protein